MSKLSDLLLKELESFNTEISKEELKKKIQINKAINETAKNLNEIISLEIEFEKLMFYLLFCQYLIILCLLKHQI